MNPAGSRYLAVPGDGRFFSLKLSTSFDTDVPAEVLFDRIVDFDWLAHRIMRNGGCVSRIDPTREPEIGLGWNIGFLRNRKAQSVRVKIEQFDRPAAISVSAQSKTSEALTGDRDINGSLPRTPCHAYDHSSAQHTGRCHGSTCKNQADPA